MLGLDYTLAAGDSALPLFLDRFRLMRSEHLSRSVHARVVAMENGVAPGLIHLADEAAIGTYHDGIEDRHRFQRPEKQYCWRPHSLRETFKAAFGWALCDHLVPGVSLSRTPIPRL